MSRRRFFVTYDISDDKRRTKVFNLLEGEGDHVQFSVFLCELDARERVTLKSQLENQINHRTDQILFLDLGPADRLPDSFLSTLGRAYSPPSPVLVI